MFKCSIIILIYLSLNTDLVLCQQVEVLDWELEKCSNQISLYTRKVDYSNYKEFKAEMIVSSNPEEIVSFLQNIDSFKDWLPDCLESKKLIQINDKEQINYILTDVPWPYEDRDITYKFSVIDKNPELGVIKIYLENIPEFIPKKKNIVRIPKSEGFWTITPIDKNKTKVAYQMHLEPGGYVPAWLANLKLIDTPYTFLYNLRLQIENVKSSESL